MSLKRRLFGRIEEEGRKKIKEAKESLGKEQKAVDNEVSRRMNIIRSRASWIKEYPEEERKKIELELKMFLGLIEKHRYRGEMEEMKKAQKELREKIEEWKKIAKEIRKNTAGG
ncbi:MAG: hypothetical protein QXK00_01130 [archaeon]